MSHTRRDLLGYAAMVSLPLGQGLAAQRAAAQAPSGSSASLTFEIGPEPAAPPLREGHAVSGTARLWWWDTGGIGPAIVLLHPATGSGHIWRYQQQAFVDAGFRVVGYSRRGAASSTAGEPGDTTSPEDDLRAVLANVGLERFYLLGTAAGAFTALAFARETPENVLGLVIANSLVGVSGGDIDRMLEGIQLSALGALPVEIRELSPSYRAANPAGTARWLELTHGAAARPFGGGAAAAGGGANPGNPGTPPPMRTRTTLEDLRSLHLPVQLITGDADLLSPPPLLALISQYLPDCRLTRLPACGHSGYWETPELFNQTVIDFMKTQGARR